MALNTPNQLPALIGKVEANVIVETPQGSRNKFDFDPETGLFRLATAMPAGVAFPFEFGFIPSTLGEDGDPLDVLILIDAPTFVGCLVKARLVGVLEIRQTKKGKELKNDRIIAVAEASRRHATVHSLRDVPAALLEEIEHFFASYNEMKGERLRVTGRRGPKRAAELVRIGIKRAVEG
jgi:inorganic pyrophosphatase